MPRPSNRSRSRSVGILKVLGLVLFIGAAALGTLYFLNDSKWPWDNPVHAETDDEEDRIGKTPIPIGARAIPAFELVDMNHLVDAQTRKPRIQWLDTDKVKAKGYITSYADITGRVMARDKAPGYAFTESDFYPRGSKPTPALAIEAGKRGLYIEAARIEGLGSLKRFDRFELFAVKANAGADPVNDVRFSNPDVAKAQRDTSTWDTPMRKIVIDGRVIVPSMPADARNRKHEPMYIQIDEAEVAALNEALATGARISCVSLPALAANVEPVVVPPPPAPVTEIEVISGSESRIHVVPADSNANGASSTPGTNGAPLKPATQKTPPH